MAACLITIGGSTGSVLIKYTLSGFLYTTQGYPGTALYINEDAATASWQTISGDATASSSCLTMTEITSTCFLYKWAVELSRTGEGGRVVTADNPYEFDAIVVDTTVIPISKVPFTEFAGDGLLAESINALNDTDLKVTARRTLVANNIKSISYIITSFKDVPVYLRVNNKIDDSKLYIHSESTTCLPEGFIVVSGCATTTLPL